ncbi:MAG: exonuclease SbcCD subunit D [Clostridium sp.]|nr:exonuclease SbcCD subunit D [Clostridium sp.]
MKFLHISDLHLGKRINEFSMLEDQKYILNQILNIAERESVQGVMIAGDIYDKSVPSAEAVLAFDRFLTRLAEQGKKVFIVSGNHDSAERLAFGAQLMSGREVYVSPVYDGTASKIRLEDQYGELFVYLLPFIKPAIVRYALGEEFAQKGERFPETYQEAAALALKRMGADRQARNILVAHQFVTGADRCESEEIIVGGLDNVDAELFDDFDYVALGHIHSPQWVKRKTVRYCGTPLKYSFSEAAQEKSATIVELREKGVVEICTVPLKPLRDMRKIRGAYMEVAAKSFYQDMNREDYVQITLTDEEDIPDGFAKLRIIYPNLTRLLYDNSRTRENRAVEAVQDIEEKSELELFEEFYEMQNNQAMSDEQREYSRRLIESLKET